MERLSRSLAGDMLPLFSAALEQVDSGVILFDAQNRIVHFNKAMEVLSGWPCAEAVGRNLGILAPAAMRERYDSDLHPGSANRVRELASQPRDVQLVRKDGQMRWISVSLAQTPGADGQLHMAFIRDVTARRQRQERERLLSLGFDETQSAVLIADARGRVVHLNKGFCRLFGFDASQALRRHVARLLVPDRPRRRAVLAHAKRLLAGDPVCCDERVACRDGRPLWCSISINPIFDDYGTLANLVIVLMDITHTKVHEVLQHRMLDALVREVPTSEVMQMMCRDVEQTAPQVLCSVLRVEEGRLRTLAAPSLPEAYTRQVDGIPVGPGVGSCGTAAHTGQMVVARDIALDPNWQGISHLALEHGLAACWSTPIKASDGRVLGTFAFYYRHPHEPDAFHRRLVEVIVHLCALALEREEARNRIRRLAFYDDLTGLPNRNLLHAQTDQAIATAGAAGQALAVLFIDLDRFKQINDSFGHPGGDQLLRAVSRRLQDEAGTADIVGRLSGDEFVMVLSSCDAQSAGERAERILRRLSLPLQLDDVQIRPSASVGISMFPHDGHDTETLLHHADMAMYQAKNSGRNGARFYSREMDHNAQERLALETALREAVERRQLHLHYQPQVGIGDGCLRGVEALARWRHPHLGDVPPMRFIPLAEECGLIGDIGHWVLEEACAQLARWRRAGLEVPSVAVNLSPTNFHDLELPLRIEQVLRREALAPGDLTVEITEDVLLDTDPSTLRTLHAVHALGVRLSMDDFGTGYSSLSYLRLLPISELKLDRSFVRGIESDEVASALTRAIAHIGQSLRLTVVAEGVESAEQLRLLGEQGYCIAQGYHFTPALPAPELESWIRGRMPAIRTAQA
ncbi:MULTISPECIES: EAL domain-containing protein [Stenotrophomonas]|nr:MULTISPECIES: EAL domain-containing protein [Stenotrophomonas]